MSQNTAAMLAKISQMEVAIADLRAMLVAPSTPEKAKAVGSVPGAPVKVGGNSLSDADLDAMVRAGVKVGAQIKTLGKTVFKSLGIPEDSWEASREQWKEYRAGITDDEAKALASEPVLTEEMCETLKVVTDSKTKKAFDATTRTKRMEGDFADHEIHPILFNRAGKEWREWAEVHGLGKRAKAPPQSSRTKSPKAKKEVLPDLLSAEMLTSIRESTDKHGKPFHSGSQKRSLADTFTGLGIAEEDHARATQEWKAYARAYGISRTSSTAGSTKSSSKGSEGAPEELSEGVGPAMPEAPAAKLPPKLTIKSGGASASASSSGKVLKPDQCVRISEIFSTNPMPADLEIRKVLRMIGVPHSAFMSAVDEWREWAKDNHCVTDDEDLDLVMVDE